MKACPIKQCIQAFESGLIKCPKDDFLQRGLSLLRDTKARSVKGFFQLCHKEIQTHLGPNARPLLSYQSAWKRNVALAKHMVQWILSNRHSHAQQSFLQQQWGLTCFHLSVLDMTAEEKTIWNTAWSFLEQVSGIQRGSWPSIINHLQQRSTQTPLLPQQSSPPASSSSSPSSRPMFHPSQVDIAQAMFDALKSCPQYRDYDSVDFCVLMPAKTTLLKQTRERMTLLLLDTILMLKEHANLTARKELMELINKTYRAGGCPLKKSSRVEPQNSVWNLFDGAEEYIKKRVIATRQFQNGQASQKFLDLCQAIYEVDSTTGKRKLMLIVMDEAHYGVGRNSQTDILLHGAPHCKSGLVPNPWNALCEPNVHIVSI